MVFPAGDREVFYEAQGHNVHGQIFGGQDNEVEKGEHEVGGGLKSLSSMLNKLI